MTYGPYVLPWSTSSATFAMEVLPNDEFILYLQLSFRSWNGFSCVGRTKDSGPRSAGESTDLHRPAVRIGASPTWLSPRKASRLKNDGFSANLSARRRRLRPGHHVEALGWRNACHVFRPWQPSAISSNPRHQPLQPSSDQSSTQRFRVFGASSASWRWACGVFGGHDLNRADNSLLARITLKP